ncbi:MAG: hypothetical protein NTV12_03565 [Verrucomicrobia bacterium]|nr:hypothetical protein [Verrucomicrobiota bacterium]
MKPLGIILALAVYALPLTRAAYDLSRVDVTKIPPAAKTKVDFAREIYPIFKEKCISCHGPEKQKGSYRIDTKDGAFKAGDNGFNIIPDHSERSPIVLMIAGQIDEMLMPPPKAEPLTPEEIGLVRAWVDQGAVWPDGPIREFIKKVDFVRDVQPVLQKSCLECHGAEKQAGGFRLDQKAAALKGGQTYGVVIKPGDAAKSSFLLIVAGKDEDIAQPEKHQLGAKQVELLRRWIEQGADWP